MKKRGERTLGVSEGSWEDPEGCRRARFARVFGSLTVADVGANENG